VRTGPSAATMDTSSPSRIHVTPRAVTTSQCHRDQGKRSIRCGILVLMGAVGAVGMSYRIIDRHLARRVICLPLPLTSSSSKSILWVILCGTHSSLDHRTGAETRPDFRITRGLIRDCCLAPASRSTVEPKSCLVSPPFDAFSPSIFGQNSLGRRIAPNR
jgi:hypothetical protein